MNKKIIPFPMRSFGHTDTYLKILSDKLSEQEKYLPTKVIRKRKFPKNN